MRTPRFPAASSECVCDARGDGRSAAAAGGDELPAPGAEDAGTTPACALIEQFLAESRQHFGL